MKYTYKIDNVNIVDEKVGVIYIPEDGTLRAHFKTLGVDSFAVPVIEKAIIANAPIELWYLEKERVEKHGKNVQTLIGRSRVFEEEATQEARVEEAERIPIEEVVANLKDHINSEITHLLQEYKNKYSREEVELWDRLYEQAVIITSNDDNYSLDKTSLIASLAEAKNISVTELAKKVIQRRANYEAHKEELVIESKRRLTKAKQLLEDHRNKKINRNTALDELGKLPFYQPVSDDE